MVLITSKARTHKVRKCSWARMQLFILATNLSRSPLLGDLGERCSTKQQLYDALLRFLVYIQYYLKLLEGWKGMETTTLKIKN